MKNVAYAYSIVRYVDDSMSGECLNIAVVLFDLAKRELQFRFPSSFPRLKSAFPTANVVSIKHDLNSIEENLRKYFVTNQSADLNDALEWALPLDESSIRNAKLGVGLTQDLARAADELLERFVLRCEPDFDKVEVIENVEHRITWDRVSSGPEYCSSNDDHFWVDEPSKVPVYA